MSDTVFERIDNFHAHLDICSQCRKHPFDLCPTGAKLLEEAATHAEATRSNSMAATHRLVYGSGKSQPASA